MPRLTITLVSLALASGGCASSGLTTPGAPEWFETQANEIRRQGFPRLRDVPASRPESADPLEVEQRANTLRVEFQDRTEAEKLAPLRTPDEIRATAAQLRAKAEASTRPARAVAQVSVPAANGSP